MAHPQTWKAFGDELQKIAEVPVESDLEAIRKRLKPGDILVTKPHWKYLLRNPHQIPLRVALTTIQGTPWTHSALYAGDGRIVDAGSWNGEFAVHNIGLKRFAKRYAFKVLRVGEVAKTERDDAVEWAKKQVGKAFDKAHLIRLALPAGKVKLKERVRQADLRSMICSQLISNAYPNKNFGAGRKIEDVRPVDIQRSSLTKTVAIFKK